MTDELVTITTCMYPHEAEMIRMMLESEGIECFIADEITYRTIEVPLLAGGIKVRVREEDAEKAAQILQDAENKSPGE